MRLPGTILLGATAAAVIAGQFPLIAAALGEEDAAATAGTAQKPVFGGMREEKEEEEATTPGANPLTRDFRRKVVRWLGEWHVPGLAVGVVDGENTWTEVRTVILFGFFFVQGWEGGFSLSS